MRNVLIAGAVLAAGCLLATDVWAQGCPSSNNNNNFSSMSSQRSRNRSAIRNTGQAAGSLVSQYLSAIGGSGGIGGMGGIGSGTMSGGHATRSTRERSRRSPRTVERRERRAPPTGGKVATDEQRAIRFVQSAQAAEPRGDLRVAFAYYRLASKTGDNFEAYQAMAELERLTKKMAN